MFHGKEANVSSDQHNDEKQDRGCDRVMGGGDQARLLE